MSENGNGKDVLKIIGMALGSVVLGALGWVARGVDQAAKTDTAVQVLTEKLNQVSREQDRQRDDIKAIRALLESRRDGRN